MKKKLLRSLMICLVMCLSVGLFVGCSIGSGNASEGGGVSDIIEDPDSGDYDNNGDYKSTGEVYTGFNMVLGTNGDILISDPISGKIKTFNVLVKRQIDVFVSQLIARLKTVWGDGWGLLSPTIPVENGYKITLTKPEGTTESGANLDDPNSYKSDLTKNEPFNDVIIDGVRYTRQSGLGSDGSVTAYVRSENQNLRGLYFYNAITGGEIFVIEKVNVWNETTSTTEEKSAYVVKSAGADYEWVSDLGNVNEIKMAIAKILAYGDDTHSGTYDEAVAKIDHLGFLTVTDEEGTVKDEVEKIIDYILNKIIGANALAQDTIARNKFSSNVIPSSWLNQELAQNYRAYAVLVPQIVKSALESTCSKTEGEETTTYMAYPKLPRVEIDKFLFPETEPKEDSGNDNEIDFDTDSDVDFISMDDFKEIKSIIFMPKEDVSIVAFMLAFEAKGRDVDGSLTDIKVELEVSFTIVSDGKTIIKDIVVSGMGAEGGRVTINPGVYDGENNDNSAMFNVSSKIKELLEAGQIADNEGIPANGVVTVKKYDGSNPFGVTNLYGDDYTTTANASGVGCSAGLKAGNNYIEMKFSVVKAVRVQGTTEEPFEGTVLLKLMVGDPIS